MREAFHIATTGRPGPVLLDIPKDIVDAKNPTSAMDWYWPDDAEVRDGLPGYRPTTKGHPRKIREAAELILSSERPVIYAGGGILKARAADALRELAELCDIHVVTTLMARGAFPDSHELCLGMPGMHGNYTAVTSMQRSDLLIALGSRFDDRVTGKVPAFAPEAQIIHVDIDPAELGKVRRPDVPIVGDCRLVIEELVAVIKRLLADGRAFPDRTPWKQTISGWQERYPLTYQQSEPGDALKPQYVLEQLRDGTPDGTIVASGVGQHQMWTSQYWRFEHPYTWVNSGGLGTMGFAVPAAIGAKVGRPDAMVWAVDGDGCFQMTAQELVTAAAERIPVKVAILNNAYLGMVRQWQEMFYEERYSEVYLSPDLPDYKLWAEAMGCVGMRVDSPEEVESAIQKANEIDDRPGGDRLPHRLVGEGLPDGRRRPEQRRHHHRPGATGKDMRPMSEQTHAPPVRARREQGRRAGAACRASSPGAASTSSAWPWPPPRTSGSRRITLAVDAESTPLEQVTKQLFKLINVVKITELDPSAAVERELLLVTVTAPADGRSQIIELVDVFEGKILNVGHERLTISLEGHPDKLDDFEELLRPYGIAELARTGRVALPRIDNAARLRAAAPAREPDWCAAASARNMVSNPRRK